MNDTNADKVYKTSGFVHEVRSDLETQMEKFKDPLVLGELMYKLLEERENTNRILKNILAKLEQLEGMPSSEKEILLPEVDEGMLQFVSEQGKATAEDVRARFNYKGSNAASARLNRLYERGLLEKKQVGRKIYFLPKV